jgi:hypothetical protein
LSEGTFAAWALDSPAGHILTLEVLAGLKKFVGTLAHALSNNPNLFRGNIQEGAKR